MVTAESDVKFSSFDARKSPLKILLKPSWKRLLAPYTCSKHYMTTSGLTQFTFFKHCNLLEFLNVLQIWIDRQSILLPGDFSFGNWSTARLCISWTTRPGLHSKFSLTRTISDEVVTWWSSTYRKIEARILKQNLRSVSFSPTSPQEQDINPHCWSYFSLVCIAAYLDQTSRWLPWTHRVHSQMWQKLLSWDFWILLEI